MDFDLTDEQRMFRETVHDWVEREAPKSYANELERREDEYPFELWDKMTEAGFHGISVPEEYGGQGGDIVMQMILAREISRSLAGLTWVWGNTSFAGAKSVGLYGSDEQKQKILPAIVEGKARCTIGFTEPNGGTDLLGAMRTFAKRAEGGWVLNGTKTWCTQAHVADYILLLARTDKNVEKRHQGVTLFLLPKDTPGVTITHIPKLGMRAVSSCDVFLEDAFIPDEWVLGEPGQAWYMLLPTLNNERILLAAFCCGILDAVLEDAVQYSKERMAFGKPIGQFQSLQHYIADIAMMRSQSELLTYQAAWLQSQGRECFQETTFAKVVASDSANKAADLGIQILGGMGYAAETNMQRYWRDSRLFRIGPVTNEMARNSIAENLGLPRSF
jgi:alkylation response protein AidB-like acyl-CoA dehydrogenase